METAVSNFILSFYRRFTRCIKKPKYTQVDRSLRRILPKPRGNYVYSGEFPPFPVRITTEPAENIYGRCRQYSRRNFTVPEPLTSHRFQLSEKKRNVTISGRILMESPSYPKGSDRKQQRISPEIIGKYNVS
jgi:hypothetical protein